jgi:hypothetical protein
MKKTKFFLFICVVATAFVAGNDKETDVNATRRGKVVASGQTGIFNLKLHTASMFSFQSADSTEVMAGEICVIDRNDQPTGDLIDIVPRRFPAWFVFGCEEAGTIVSYKIVQQGNIEKALVQFSRRQRRGPSQE